MSFNGNILAELKRKAEAVVDYAEPYIPAVGVFAVMWLAGVQIFPLSTESPYGSFPQLHLIEAILAIPLVLFQRMKSRMRSYFPYYFLFYSLLSIPYCLFYLVMKTGLDQMNGLALVQILTSIILIVAEPLFIATMLPLAYALAVMTVLIQDGTIHYRNVDPVVIVMFICGSCITLIISRLIRTRHEARVSLMKNMSGAIAHEMRTPLNSALMAIDIIKAMLPASPGLHKAGSVRLTQLETIHKAIDRGAEAIAQGNRIIESILASLSNQAISRHNFRLFSAEQSIREAIDRYAFNSPEEKQIVHIGPAGDFSFFGDMDLFAHLISNLLKNALHYQHDREGFRIDIATGSSPQGNRITVRDNGPGIPDKKMKEIFKPFYTSGKPAGNGLGLTFCQKIVESFGGRISCSSLVGEWTEFAIELPTIESGFAEKLKLEILEKKSVLVVDDQAVNRTMLSRILGGLNCKSDQADNGKAALEMASKNRYDLILMDIEMPVMNGDEACRRIKSGIDIDTAMIQHYRNVPIIAVTGLPEAEAKRRASLMDGFLLKPIGIEKVRRLLEQQFFTARQGKNIPETMTTMTSIRDTTVLLVENDTMTRHLLHAIIESAGHKTITAENGRQALELLDRVTIDIVLMDLDMPVMDGIETVTAIRKGSAFRHFRNYEDIPVIAMSGHSGEIVEKALQSGFNDYLSKPVRRQELVQAITSWLDRQPDREKTGVRNATKQPWQELLSVEMLDHEVLKEMAELAHDNLLEQLVEMFTQDSKKVIADLLLACSNRDADKAMRASHTLKGSAASIGAARLQAAATKIDGILRQGGFPEDDGWEGQLETVYRESVASLTRHIGEAAKASA